MLDLAPLPEQVLLLSCFDGMGCAAKILKDTTQGLALYLSWEVDPECIALIQHHHPEAECRGDFLHDDPEQVVQRILQVDPTGQMILLFVSAPPCPDFSRIRADAPGSAGPEGQKFTQYCAFANQVEMKLPHKRVGHLVENVVMNKAEADTFSAQLDANCIMADGADHGIISRPRLWWQRIPWGTIRTNPLTGERLRWSKHQKFHQLNQDVPFQDVDSLELNGMKLFHTVRRREKLIPCLTTPAPTDAGRPAPKKMRGKMSAEQRQRWMADGQMFAPWQYADEAMLHSDRGDTAVPNAVAKEQFHQLPIGYTEHPKVKEMSRHRLLANGWHYGTAKLLMLLVLNAIMVAPLVALPVEPQRSAIQRVVEVLDSFPPQLGPGSWTCEPLAVPPAGEMWDHWKSAKSAVHGLQLPPFLEPGLRQCLQLQQLWGSQLPSLRTAVVDEVQTLIEEHADTTLHWWRSLPHHVAQVYYNNEWNEITQIPVFLQLLQQLKMPGLDELSADLLSGFDIIGPLHDGPGWLPRRDQKYEFPVDHHVFKEHNKRYVTSKLQQGRVDPHWAVMLSELEQELDKGRMEGPFHAPSWWPCRSRDLPGRPCQPLPDDDIAVSFCFSVEQSDKVRRCEDFRRSGHNSTVTAFTTPHHHDVKTFSMLALATDVSAGPPKIWAQDLASAYRQFPVKEPNHCWCALNTPEGTVLVRHRSLMFGASASVWHFNRSADAIMFLARRALALSIGHYVDDFLSVERADLVDSGFHEFTRLARLLGLRMKEAKALAPSSSQKVLGVNMSLTDTDVTLSPHPSRCHKVSLELQRALDDNVLSPDKAQRLTGKLVFLTSSLFGQLGRAALQPLYSRSHGLGQTDKSCQLNTPLKSAIKTLLTLLREVSPRVIPRHPKTPLLVIYTDAFFSMGDKTFSPGGSRVPHKWPSWKSPSFVNGWGFVWHYEGVAFYAAGRVPASLIRLFCRRKAFIYFLEVVTQLIAFLACKDVPTTLILSFIDNSSGYFALRKGFSKDEPICNLIALTWRLIARLGWHLQLEWVPSGHNISDQVSRHVFTEMEMVGARLQHGCLDPLFDLLMRVASNQEYTHGAALDDLLALSLFQDASSCTGRVDEWSQCGEKRLHHGHSVAGGLQPSKRAKRSSAALAPCNSKRSSHVG